jgi:hypothetical protein
MFAWKKVFLNKQWLEPTIVGTNNRAKAPRFSHHDCGVIEQKVVVQMSHIKTALGLKIKTF